VEVVLRRAVVDGEVVLAGLELRDLPAVTTFLISMPRSLKNPFWIPRSIGRALAMGSVSTVTVVRDCAGVLLAAVPKHTSTVARTTAAAPSRPRIR
jgi:hypothetical protein